MPPRCGRTAGASCASGPWAVPTRRCGPAGWWSSRCSPRPPRPRCPDGCLPRGAAIRPATPASPRAGASRGVSVARSDRLSAAELDLMREACRLAADTLVMVGEHLQAGMTTQQIDELVHAHTVAQGAWPAPLNYRGFPKSVCTSVNACVCHGIPGTQVLRDGDIINVDVTSIFPKERGFFGDTSATFYIGEPSAMARHVTEVARESLELGIAAVRPGGRLGDVGHAIQRFVESKGCSVVRDYTGHGIGRRFHTEPTVKHYGRPGEGARLKPGMLFTIEPMVNLGGWETELLRDGWTVMTADRSLSAQFEHTVLVTDDGVEVLTRRDRVLRGSEDVPWARLGPLSGPPVDAGREAARA
ncbi:MAG: type I methionyl aminopeptidase [Alphaproteobacteria bacterium]|nr:type I methionyl aminopeptidase [Alphaproteobacteria bacterium]